MRGNPQLDSARNILRQAYAKTKASVWRDASERLGKSRSRRARVNVGKISRVTAEGAAAFVPGKVLGGGRLTHPVVVGAFSFSQNSIEKILRSGGKALTIVEFVRDYPDGKGVALIGG